jgi:hypothetical protein
MTARASTLDLFAAVGYATATARRALATAAAAAAAYCLLVLTAFPGYTAQLLGADATYLGEALVALSANTAATAGVVGIALVVLYALVTGVAVVVAVGQFRFAGGTAAASGSVSGVLPGLVASGCASCGAGLLGALGFAGALAALPFHGNLLRVAGLAVLVWFLARAGDPSTCRV